MTTNILLILASLLFISSNLSAQFTDDEMVDFLKSATLSELITQNTVFIMEGNYYQAGLIAEKLVEKDPENSNFNYRMGLALIQSPMNSNKAEPFLLKAENNLSKKYSINSVKETNAPYETLYYLGKFYHISNDIDKAENYFNLFLEHANKKSENIEYAKLRLQQCQVARKLLGTNNGFELVNLGNEINSSYPDYASVVSLDGSALYYTSRRLREDSSNISFREYETNLYAEDIYVSYKDFDNNWTKSKVMEFCLPDRNEATVSVSIDERRIYVYKDDDGIGNIYYSDFANNQFNAIQKLETKGVNTENWEPHISVTPDGKTRYFTSDRPGGFGGRDIYYIDLLDNNEWSEPKNMGSTINTEYDEDSPFMAVDNKTFYFSSNNPNSMGGFDVFVTYRNEEGNWSIPKNLGAPLNSTGDDIYYTTTFDGNTGYISSNRFDSNGHIEIYEIKNTHLGIQKVAALIGEISTVNNEKLPEDIAYTLTCMDCEDKFPLTLFPRISDGIFLAPLKPCKTYELTFHHNKGETVFHTETFNTNCIDEYHEIYRHILIDVEKMELVEQMDEIKSFDPLEMKHFFGYNRNQLDPSKGALKAFLDAIQDQVNEGRESLNITVNASASKVRTRTFKSNQDLAESRAHNIKEFLNSYFRDKDLAINISIGDITIQGPEYKQRDFENIEKYAPFQYVSLQINGINSLTEDIVSLNSKDEELEKGMVLKGSTKYKMTDDQGDSFNKGTVIESDYSYHIIAGVFNRIKYAEGLVENLKKEGFPNAKIIGKRNGLHVVAIDSFNTIQEARKLQEKAREQINSSVWLLNLAK